jgi:hypothetical protein
MSKIPAILSATLSVTLAACGKEQDHTPIGQPVTTPLVTAEPASVGTVSVFNSTDGLFVTATPAAGWQLSESRLSVALSLGCIPQSKSGAPNLDRFVLRKKKTGSSGEMTYALPLLVPAGTELFISLYAELRQISAAAAAGARETGDCGEDGKSTSAWAQGTPFIGKSGMYLRYTVRDAAPPSLAGKYRTYSQENWGAASQDNAAAGYLGANFFRAFPLGATIGSSIGFSAQFTIPQAVADFLPQAGAAGPLIRRSVNPRDLANPFAGATLALTLNTGFDAADAAFSAGDLPLTALVVADPASPLYGLTVAEILSTANDYLAGRADLHGVLLEDVYDAVTRINANFEGGLADAGFLGMP